MDSIGAFDAKTHLSELLERAQRGERILITKRRQPVAMLVPAVESPRFTPLEAAERILEMRVDMGGASPSDLRDEARRR